MRGTRGQIVRVPTFEGSGAKFSAAELLFEFRERFRREQVFAGRARDRYGRSPSEAVNVSRRKLRSERVVNEDPRPGNRLALDIYNAAFNETCHRCGVETSGFRETCVSRCASPGTRRRRLIGPLLRTLEPPSARAP